MGPGTFFHCTSYWFLCGVWHMCERDECRTSWTLKSKKCRGQNESFQMKDLIHGCDTTLQLCPGINPSYFEEEKLLLEI